MAFHKLHIDDFDEVDYQLFAIHTVLEDYRLAYFINQFLHVNLCKSENNIHINNKDGETQFSQFIFEDEEKDVVWNLIQNMSDIQSSKMTHNQGLFDNGNFKTKAFLLPEYKKVDFFLKVENSYDVTDVEILSSLKKIDRINTAYTVDLENIKSKSNLIF